jgi:XTP/dITP diphosphohydrolase
MHRNHDFSSQGRKPMPTAPPVASRLVIATRNRKKGAELTELLDPPWEEHPSRLGLVIEMLDSFPSAPEVEEDAETFAGNARKKASETARALGTWVVADDSGLTVDALDGAPGVCSARYAGQHGDDEANNRKLLAELTDVPDERRGAAFVCTLALADPAGEIRLESEGICRGRIAHAPRGTEGFGYDPLFILREYHKTFGELSPIVKQQLSHRARACTRLRTGLSRVLFPTDALSMMRSQLPNNSE